MICLFNNKATKEQLMTTNGDYILDAICTKSIVSEKTNEDYSCQFSFKLSKDYSNEINALVEDAVLRVEDEEGEENFRIVSVTKTTNYVEVFTVHITIRDIINMWLEDVRPVEQNGQGAISWIFDNAKGGNDFNVTSNISNLNTAYYENMNVYNALYGAENSFINKWGGETRRRGFNIAINDKIGIDRGMQIRSKKNLTGFEVKTNLDQLCTTLYVKGFDGIKLNNPVISPLINNYSKPFYKEIKYEDIKVKSANNPDEGYDTLLLAQAEMQRRAELEFSKNNIDSIQATYTIKFAQLEKTEEYKNYSMIEKAFLGDTVSVFEDNYGIDIKVRVVGRTFNVLKQERTETTLSNVDIKTKPLKVEDILKQLEEGKQANGHVDLSGYIDAMMKSGIKDSFVVMKENELLIMDSKDINTAINVCRYNKNGMGFSQNGYWGTYQYGFTIDGKINASMISTGVLLADLIKAGILKSFDNSTWINMENGHFNFADKISYDGTNFAIDLTENESVNSKVGNEEFGTYKTQTATTIGQKVSSGNGFKTEFNQNTTSFDFTIGNDGTGVKIDKNGVTIKNGALNVVNANGQTTIDGSKFLHNIEMYGNGAISLADGEIGKTISIPHNKGYNPDFKGAWLDLSGQVYSDPYHEYSWGSPISINTVCQISVDTQNLHIFMQRNSGSTSGTKTLYYRYFILGGIHY